jgi:archaetidylinositol phosphate synthase
MRRRSTIERPWDQRLANAAIRPFSATRITPNQITTMSLILGLAGALLLARGGGAMHAGALLFVVSFWLDHVDGELARMTGRTSGFGHYYDLAAGGAVLVATFIGIGIGLDGTALGPWAPVLGLTTAGAIAIIFVLRGELERQFGKPSTRQPSLLGFEIEDVLYLLGPITWLGGLTPFLLLAGIGTPLFALWVLWECRLLVRRGHRAW